MLGLEIGGMSVSVLLEQLRRSPLTLLCCSLSIRDGKYGLSITSLTLSSSKVLIGDFAWDGGILHHHMLWIVQRDFYMRCCRTSKQE